MASCVDPVGTDDGGHGTHVAGTIGAAANGTGVSGVAPGVSLVELKGGQDSGYFFLDPVVKRAHLRRRPRYRRGQHVVLRRPVAVQLHRQPGACGYYTYLAGTSMASPHAAGVAALIVSRYGHRDPHNGGLTMNPNAVERQLYRTAAEHACPTPRTRSYAQEGFSAEFDATCVGGKNFNGFYGYGIVDAYAAVGGKHWN